MLSVIGTDQHNQGSPKRSQWSKSKGDEEGLSRWDLALGTDCDRANKRLIPTLSFGNQGSNGRLGFIRSSVTNWQLGSYL